MGFAGAIIGTYLAAIPVLLYLSIDLPAATQALVLATALSSVGTLALALATFVNVSQANERLEIQQKKQRKPLALDEISHVVQPTINALENNLRQFQESTNPGCAFEWVYISGPSLYGPSKGPDSVRARSMISAARMANENEDLYTSLETHDRYVQMIVDQAQRLHEELEPEIERSFEEKGITDESTKAVTSAVLLEIDEWGENGVMTEFWNENRDKLIKYAEEQPEVSLSDVQSLEAKYRDYLEETRMALMERKADLMQEYSISEDDITVGVEEIRDAI